MCVGISAEGAVCAVEFAAIERVANKVIGDLEQARSLIEFVREVSQ